MSRPAARAPSWWFLTSPHQSKSSTFPTGAGAFARAFFFVFILVRCAHKPPAIYGSLKFLEAFPPRGSATQAGLAAKTKIKTVDCRAELQLCYGRRRQSADSGRRGAAGAGHGIAAGGSRQPSA